MTDRKHIFPYLILVLILSFGFGSLMIFSGNKFLQFKIGVVTAFLYVVWGVVHHLLEGSLYLKIVVEYIFVALLAIAILAGLLL